MGDEERSWAVWAFFLGSPKLQPLAGKLTALRHIRHAVMLATPPAARRQVRLTRRCQGEEWGDERQAESGQQQDGKQLTQCPYIQAPFNRPKQVSYGG